MRLGPLSKTGDAYEVNRKFASKKIVVDLNQVVRTEAVAEAKEVERGALEDRKLAMQVRSVCVFVCFGVFVGVFVCSLCLSHRGAMSASGKAGYVMLRVVLVCCMRAHNCVAALRLFSVSYHDDFSNDDEMCEF